MKTVILCPFELNIDGIVHYYVTKEGLEIRYHLNFGSEKRVATLWGLSSRKPNNVPCKIDIPFVKNSMAEGLKVISEGNLSMLGYNLGDIDTFALTCKSPIGHCLSALGYGGLSWNITYSIGRISEARQKTVMQECIKNLDKIKKHSNSPDTYTPILKGLAAADQNLRKTSFVPLDGYTWYKYEKDVYPFDMSIYAHLTDTQEFAKAYQSGRVCYLGIRDVCHTALALESKFNPFTNAEDVTVFLNGYWIVGIGLLPEGQFFEKVLTKKKCLPNG